MDLERYITGLLAKTDCVIIPGFGGFIANRVPARVDPARNIIHPPSKKISFNCEIRHNDGLLASHIALMEKIPYEESMNRIKRAVGALQNGIEEKGIYEFGSIGCFRMNPENKLLFTPDPGFRMIPDFFGLEPLTIQPIEVLDKSDAKHGIRELDSQFFYQKRERKHLLIAASAAIFLLAGSFILFALNRSWLHEFKINYSSFDIFKEENKSYSARDTLFTVLQPAAVPDTVEIWLNKISSDTLKTRSVADDEEPAVISSGEKQYFIIGGCFKIYANVEKFIRKEKKRGFNPEIVDKTGNGLYRVCYDKYSTRYEALKTLKKIRGSMNGDAWLLEG
ncbi:MAG: HU-CCDC81 and SPOR domain-containing protein [Bacteroidetes bacterium]|nr:HU-CCDC81 and SPOR domain-containing protein [Bacteroidota bacterium]